MTFRTRELWKQLMKTGRIRPANIVLQTPPNSDADWCEEAVQLSQESRNLGILATVATKKGYQQNRAVFSVESRNSSEWWRILQSGHPQGPTTGRSLGDYLSRIQLILTSARSLMFIDPHLDPRKPGYSRFLDLIDHALARPSPKPLIEIHRCCYEGSGDGRRVVDKIEWERRFNDRWAARLQAKGIGIEVFIWSDFHDRYLLSDLLGIHLGNGFDLTEDANKRVTWTRMSASDRDASQRHFDPSVNRAKLIHQFKICP